MQVQAYREYKEDCIGPALTGVMENSIKVHTTTQPHEVYVACACMHCIHAMACRLRKSKRTGAGKVFIATSRRKS